MKKIGIDARLYSKTGVGVYIRNLLHFLEKSLPNDIVFYIYLMPEDYDKVDFSSDKFVKRKAPYRWHTISEQIGFYKLLYSDNLDLMHFTYFSYPVFYRRKFIATVHDTILLEHKTGKASTKNTFIYELKHFFFRYVIMSQLQHASVIITPTQTVKNQIVQLFGSQYEQKIVSIYEGVDYEIESKKENTKLSNIYSGNFFMYVGNFYPHKNIEKLIEAFAKTSIDAKLILIGPDDYFSNRILERIKNLSQSERIIIYNNAPPEDLIFFYKNALALIHPSLSEGFGLSLIEAMYFGLPIIASKISVFTELLQNNFDSFDPTDIDSIAKTISQYNLAKTKKDYSALLSKYSFQKMTEEILQIYQKN